MDKFLRHFPSQSKSASGEYVPTVECSYSLFVVSLSLSPLYRIKIQLSCVELRWQPVAIFPHGSSNPAVCEDIFNYDPIKTTHSSVGGGAEVQLSLPLSPPGGGETSDSTAAPEPLSAHLVTRLTTTYTHHTHLQTSQKEINLCIREWNLRN